MSQETPHHAGQQIGQRLDAYVGIVRAADVRPISSITIETVAGPRSFLFSPGESTTGRILVSGALQRWLDQATPVFVTTDGGTLRLNDDTTSVKADLIAEW